MAIGDPIKVGSAATPTLVRQVGSGPRKLDSGLDTLTRRYLISAIPDALPGLGVLPAMYSPDRENVYSQMYLVDRDAKLIEGASSEVTLEYVGLVDGNLPAVKRDQGFSIQTASYNDGEQQLEILYRAPHTVHRWIGRTDALAYQGYTGSQPPTILVRRADGHIPIIFRYADAVRNSVGYAMATDAQRTRIDAWLNSHAVVDAIERAKQKVTTFFNRAFTQEDDTEFESKEIVPGRFFECVATTHRRLVSV